MSKRILIGDIGSTRGDWVIIGNTSDRFFQTPGYNPLVHGANQFPYVAAMLEEPGAVDEVQYYGAGVVDADVAEPIKKRLAGMFGEASVTLFPDLLGAARAVYGDTSGTIAVLGTGSSCAYYDGRSITDRAPSLGYPHGDEGGGWRIGLAMLKGYYYGHMPADLQRDFTKIHHDTRVDFLDTLRRHAFPNAYLASFATFAGENAGHPWVRDTVSSCFEAFVVNHLFKYAGKGPVGCAGGIAWTFRTIFTDVLNTHGMSLGICIKEPIKGLAEFHKKEL